MIMEQPVTRTEVLDIAQYEKARPAFRDQVLGLKKHRQIIVGDHFNFIFENHQTVLYQIQEMMRVERIVDEAAIAHEISTYNELIPPKGGLSATLLIEYEDAESRQQHLSNLLGLENHVALVVGNLPPVKGVFSEQQIGEDRISSVQYLVFPLEADHRTGWEKAAQAGTLSLQVDHPHYSHKKIIASEIAAALAKDFA